MSAHHLHASLIQKACICNPELRTIGFSAALARSFIITGEVDDNECFADEDVRDIDTRSIRRVRVALRRHLRLRVPDAYAIHNASEHITVWEVANHQHLRDAFSKWIPLVSRVLDVTGNYSLAVVVVDADGVCRVPYWETFGGACERCFDDAARATWRVDDACPVDWRAARLGRCIHDVKSIDHGRLTTADQRAAFDALGRLGITLDS